MEFEVVIEEKLRKKVCVDADNLQDAVEKVSSDYYDEKIILTAEDLSERNFFSSNSSDEDDNAEFLLTRNKLLAEENESLRRELKKLKNKCCDKII